MNRKKLIGISSFIFFYMHCIDVLGQQNPFELSKIIPPSPNASSLGNFGNNSKGTYNGLPEISIPLLQTSAGNQNISLALSYDASGTRTGQDASWVGLGWSFLNGGGVITRTVRGKDDLWSGGYHFTQALPTQTQIEAFYTSPIITDYNLYIYIMSIGSGIIDVEPDIFTYSFSGNNGKFVFDKEVNGSSILELERSNLKFSYLNPGWKIIDGAGNSYYFNAQETSTSYSQTMDHELDYDADASALSNEDLTRHDITTAWYLDSIVSPTSQKITYTYSDEISMTLLSKSEQKFFLTGFYGGTCPPPEVTVYNAARQMLRNKLPYKILFDKGSIEFHTGNRTDIKTPWGYTGTNYLNDIVEKNNTGEIIKKLNFYYSYFINEDDYTGTIKRLKLDSVKDVTSASAPIPPYVFSYFNPNSLPPKYTKAIDHWGYFNNQTNNNILLPKAYMSPPSQPFAQFFPGANRLPDTTLNSVQNGVLSSITYPTGGKTNFSYELNQYTNLYGDDQYESKDSVLYLQSPGPPGPGHVSFVLNEPREVTFGFNAYDIANPYYIDEFLPDYAFLDMNGQQFMVFRNERFSPDQPFATFVYTQTVNLEPGNYTIRITPMDGHIVSLNARWEHRTPLAQRKGGGLRIKKIENMDGFGNKTIKKFLYNQDSLSSGLILLPPKYDFNLFVGGQDPCGSNLNTLYFVRYSNTLNNFGFTKDGLIGYSKVTELSGEQGENGKIEYYFYNEAIPYLSMPSFPVLGDRYNGKPTVTKFYNSTNHLLKKIENAYATNIDNSAQGSLQPFFIRGLSTLGVPFSTTSFQLLNYANPSYWVTQSKQTETVYSGVDSLVTTKNFYYENFAHKQLTKTDIQASNGNVMTTRFKYPNDFASSSAPNVYNDMVSRHLLNPVIEQTLLKNGTSFLQSTKTNYNYWYNNLWGINNANSFLLPQTVESKILNGSSLIKIRYHSYDEKGNTTSLSKENDVKKSYLWGYNKAYPVAEVIGADYSTIKGFVNMSVLDNPQTTDTQMRTELNKIRTGLDASASKALVNTYTYKPLTGITSATDQRGKTTYYEYDSFDRLLLIKDQDGKIIKKIDYKYQVNPNQ
jgi:YD repeat-containing protein